MSDTPVMIVTMVRREGGWLVQCVVDGEMVGTASGTSPNTVTNAIEDWMVKLIEASKDKPA